MNTLEFTTRAKEKGQDLSHIDIHVLTPKEMSMHLEGLCLSCADTHTECNPIEQMVEHEDHVKFEVVGHYYDIFCDLCMDHLPLEILEKYHAKKKQYRLESLEDYDGDELPF